MGNPKSSIELYLDYVDGLVGKRGTFLKITEEKERPPVWVAAYQGFPELGNVTALTYGLSSVEHQDWRLGRPELLISVKSSSEDWALAAGFVAKKYRGLCPFSVGSILRFGTRITKESEMSAFFVFVPSLFTPEEARVVLPDRTINLVQLYPIYEEEIDLVEQEGVGNFFAREDVDWSDVRRTNLGEVRH